MTSNNDSLSRASLERLRPGDVLGQYQLLCPVARGGMGQVWAARRTGRLGLPKIVAVKTALPECEPSPDNLERLFLDEARVAAAIDHPNVCRIFDLGEEHGVLYLAMEWIDGASLSALLACLPPPRRLPYRLAARVVADACAGLHAAHELRDEEGVPLDVVHRDATPQNILISTSGDVKVVDFGVVKSRDQIHQATVAGELKGKISYLSPEQLLARDVDRRADVFALGNVLYFATTGQRPFAAETAAATMMRIANAEYVVPSLVVPGYPEELERIVTCALSHDPKDRFATAEAMRVALERYVGGRDAVAPTELGAMLNEHLGVAIEARRKDIRAAQRSFESQSSVRGPAANLEVCAPEVARSSTEAAPVASVPPGTLSPLSGTLVSPVQEPASPRRRSGVLLGGAGGIALALLALFVVWLERPRSADAAASPAARASEAAAPSAEPAPGAADLVELSVRVNPDGASLTIDDQPPITTPITTKVARDGRAHVLRISAPEFAERVETVVFDRDQTLTLELAAAPVAGKPRAIRLPRPAAAPPEQSAAPAAPAPGTGREASSLDDMLEAPARRARARRTIDQGDPFF